MAYILQLSQHEKSIKSLAGRCARWSKHMVAEINCISHQCSNMIWHPFCLAMIWCTYTISALCSLYLWHNSTCFVLTWLLLQSDIQIFLSGPSPVVTYDWSRKH